MPRAAESGSFSEFNLVSERTAHSGMAQYEKRPPYNSNPYPPVYNGTTTTVVVQPGEIEPIDCKPRYCYSPYAILRWFELALFFLLHWLVQVVCGNDACTMIINQFGYEAEGQMYVILVIILLFCTTATIMICYSINLHHAIPSTFLTLERVHTIIAIVLMIPAAILGSVYAGLTVKDEYNQMGRGAGIRGQWIAAAVFEWITVVVLLFDLVGQRTANYPNNFTSTRKK